jgi:hypothetical protein
MQAPNDCCGKQVWSRLCGVAKAINASVGQRTPTRQYGGQRGRHGGVRLEEEEGGQ